MAFMLVNVFFGIIGTFWLRAQNRRGEIGLRMALGAYDGTLRRYLYLRYQYGGDGCYRYLSPAVYDGAFRYLFRYNLFNDERHDLPRYLVACAQGYPNGPGGGVALRIICRIITND